MKAKIYRIVLPCGGTYIGQTKKHVYQRWGLHLTDLDRRRHNNKQMQSSFDNGEVDEWKFEIIESLESDDKAYINLMEQHHIKMEVNAINSYGVHVDKQARQESYRDMNNENSKKYYHKNKGERRKYYHKNKGEGMVKLSDEEVKANAKASHDKWKLNNIEKVKAYQKEYGKQYRQKMKLKSSL